MGAELLVVAQRALEESACLIQDSTGRLENLRVVEFLGSCIFKDAFFVACRLAFAGCGSVALI